MKKVFSLLLCVAMLCGLITVGTIGANAEEQWVTMYDWENDWASAFDGYVAVHDLGLGGSLWRNGDTDRNVYSGYPNSTRAMKCTGGGSMYNQEARQVTIWVEITLTDDIKNAKNLRIPINPAGHDQGNGYVGLKMNDGKYYWQQLGYDWHYEMQTFVGMTLYSDPGLVYYGIQPSGEVLTVTEDNVKNVEAICYSSQRGNDSYLDDVQILMDVEPTIPKATFDNGVADVEAVDGVVTMPEATIEGEQFIGWQDAEGNLYQAGAQVEIAEDTAFTAVSAAVELQTGAGIRWAKEENERGIRFETTVSKDALDALGSSSFELGALILPYADYDADITVETATDYGALNVVDPKVYGEVEDNYRYYTGVVDFEKYFAVSQSALADLKLTAVSYVKVTYADGTDAYFYDHPDATDNVRTVAEVARAALADTEFGYTEDQINILNLYTKYSQEDTVPSYRKDRKDNPNAIEEVEFKFITDITDKVGDGFVNEPMNNGAALNDYTPTGVADLYSHANFSNGKTLVFTLPQSIAYGKYKVWFNTRGSNSNRVDNVKIEVTSDAGTFTVAENQTFYSNKSSSWWVVECPNNVEIKGTATFTFTSQSSSGKIALHDIVLTPVF